MKMKKILATALISTIVLGATMPALAAGSKGSVNFETDSIIDPTPVDPTDPSVPPEKIKPEIDGEGGGSKGSLRFDRVPNLKFENVAISNKTEIVNVLEEKYELINTPTNPDHKIFYAAPTVEISDLRGDNTGWHAQVKIDDYFVDVLDSTSKIVGSVSFATGRVTDYTGQSALIPPAVVPTSIPVTALNSTNQTFVSAGKGTGAYQWGISYYTGDHLNQGKPKPNYTGTPLADGAIKLSVAPGQTVSIAAGHTYQSNLTWTLLATPDTAVTP